MRTSKQIFLIALCLTATACGTKNQSVESVHQPVVSRTDYVFDANAGYNGIATSEAARIDGWFQSLQLGYGDRVSVDSGDGVTDNAARESVSAIAARYGLLLDARAPLTSSRVASGNVRIVVSRAIATVPGCPDWSRDHSVNFGSHNASNYGCGVNGNLAAMIADPRDLVFGRGSTGTTDVTMSSKAIKSYRDKVPNTTLKNETTGTGK